MSSTQPRLIQTFLPDGTLEGARIIELSDSTIKAYVIPRLQLNSVKSREDLLHPSLYFLVSGSDSLGYIGESENFFHRQTSQSLGQRKVGYKYMKLLFRKRQRSIQMMSHQQSIRMK